MSDTSPKDQAALRSDYKHPSAPRVRTPGEPLFEFQRGANRIVGVLRTHGAHGVEAQILVNGELFTSRMFATSTSPLPPRQLAIRWAEAQRGTLTG